MDRVRMILPERADDCFDETIKMVAAGMPLRESIEMIINAQSGALICIGDVASGLKISNGGFTIRLPFSPQRLFELSKMDGAIVLAEDLSEIICANIHLTPDPDIQTMETGMRHRAAAQTSSQTNATVIAISQRRTTTTLYLNGEALLLESDQMMLSKGNQGILALQNLKNTLERASMRLSLLELDDIVTVVDVVTMLARYQALLNIAIETERQINFLGSNSGLLRNQLEEIMGGTIDTFLLLIRDYAKSADMESAEAIARSFLLLEHDDRHDLDKAMHLLGYEGSFAEGDRISPRGFRAISRISMLDEVAVSKIIEEFGTLSAIVSDSKDGFDRLENFGEDIGIDNIRAIAKSFMQLRSTL